MRTTHVHSLKLLAVPLLGLAMAIALMLSWGPAAVQDAQAATENAKTQMDIVINGGQCNSAVDATCNLELGGTFTVSIVPSVIPVGGYTVWQTLLDYGNLTYKPITILAENKWDLSLLAVRLPADPTGKEGQIAHGDGSAFSSPFPASFQKTAFLNLTFNCSQNAGGAFSQDLLLISYNVSPSGTTYLEGDGTTINIPNVSSIQIDCKVQPVGGLMVDLTADDAAAPLDTAQSSGGSVGLLAALIGGIMAVAMTVTGAAWYARRRWLA